MNYNPPPRTSGCGSFIAVVLFVVIASYLVGGCVNLLSNLSYWSLLQP